MQAVKTDRLDLTNVFCDEEGRLPLEDAKRLVLKNLRILEVTFCTYFILTRNLINHHIYYRLLGIPQAKMVARV